MSRIFEDVFDPSFPMAYYNLAAILAIAIASSASCATPTHHVSTSSYSTCLAD